MITTEFIITTSYSVLSVIMYVFFGYLIVKNKKLFYGSYYNIILVDSAVNVYTYINSLITIRLPRNTCKNCLLAPLMPKVLGLNFFGCMFNHLAYVQYLMILSLIFNRFTAVVFPFQYKAIWKHLFLPLMLFNMLGPLVITYPWFTVTVSLVYYEPADCFVLISEPSIYRAQSVYLVPSLVVLTVFCTTLMAATFAAYSSHTRRTAEHSSEGRLLAYSVIYFLIQLFSTVVMMVQSVGASNNIPWLEYAGALLLPYISDALTFGSPYILLFCSSPLRPILKRIYLTITRKNNDVTPAIAFARVV